MVSENSYKFLHMPPPAIFFFFLHDTPFEKNFLIPPCLLRLIGIHPSRLHKLHHMGTLCRLQFVNRLKLSYVFAIGTRPCAASGTLDLSLLQPRSMFLAGSGCNFLFSFHEWRNTLKKVTSNCSWSSDSEYGRLFIIAEKEDFVLY